MRNTRRHRRPTAPRTAAIYTRISLDKTGEGMGVDRQERDCRELARRHALDVVEVFCDNDIGASGRTRKRRPRFEEMLARVAEGEFGALIFYSSSRLTRRPMEYERVIRLVEDTGVRLYSVMSGNHDLTTADGRAVARTISAWDAAESDRIGERVARKARDRAEKGLWHGGSTPPFGYELARAEDSTGILGLLLHAERADLLREAAKRVLDGESLYGIVEDWNARGFRTARNAHWRSKTLRQALLNPSAVGMRRSVDKDGIETLHPAKWDPILDRTTWERLHDVLEDPDRTFPPSDGSYVSKHALGGGLTVCDLCGKKLVSQRHRGQYRLICHKQATGGCGVTTINYAHLEDFVMRLVWEVLDTPEVYEALARQGGTDEDVVIREKLNELDFQRRRVLSLYARGDLHEGRWHQFERDLRDQEQPLQRRLADLTSTRPLASVPSLDEAKRKWDESGVHWRRAFLNAIIREVRVKRHPAGVASTLTRYTKRGETDEEFTERVQAHRAAIQRQRVVIEWRS